MRTDFRFEPLDPARFPVGEGPFRTRGLAYTGALAYVDTHLAGGRAAFLDALGPKDPFRSFYDRIFVFAADYDVSPLVRLFAVVARLQGVPVSRFVVERSRASSAHDTRGVWKPMLKTSSPEAFAERAHFAFNRYFEPSRARIVKVTPGKLEGELEHVAAPMAGLYAWSTIGFVSGALELSGAKDVDFAMGAAAASGEHAGVATEKIGFKATWRV